jgi:hypothetical protein
MRAGGGEEIQSGIALNNVIPARKRAGIAGT